MRGRQESLEHEAAALRAERVELQKNAIRLEAASRTAEIQYRELLARFQREVPSGEIRELSQLVADRLDQGVPADRIAFFINAADRVRDCGNPETKRFIVPRSEEHTSELQSLMRISYAVFCFKKKNNTKNTHTSTHQHNTNK